MFAGNHELRIGQTDGCLRGIGHRERVKARMISPHSCEGIRGALLALAREVPGLFFVLFEAGTGG